MKKILYVDAYNIIGAWTEATINNWPIDECRDRLKNKLEEYAALKCTYVVLVFDGYKSDRIFESVEKYKHIAVIYTKKDETADTYIEKAVYKSPIYYEVSVATSDALQQFSVLGNGASRISARELLRDLDNIKKKTIYNISKSKVPLSERIPKDIYLKLSKMLKDNDCDE